MDQLKQNLERILKVRDVDLGLFILAMHSLIERCLSENTVRGIMIPITHSELC